jgi:hypothetical protein
METAIAGIGAVQVLNCVDRLCAGDASVYGELDAILWDPEGHQLLCAFAAAFAGGGPDGQANSNGASAETPPGSPSVEAVAPDVRSLIDLFADHGGLANNREAVPLTAVLKLAGSPAAIRLAHERIWASEHPYWRNFDPIAGDEDVELRPSPTSPPVPPPAAPGGRHRWHRWSLAMSAAALLVACLALGAAWRDRGAGVAVEPASLPPALVSTVMESQVWMRHLELVEPVSVTQAGEAHPFLSAASQLRDLRLALVRQGGVSAGAPANNRAAQAQGFDAAVVAYARRLLQEGAVVRPVNGMTPPPATSSDRPAREYYYAQAAVDQLNEWLGPLADDAGRLSELVVHVRLDDGRRSGRLVFTRPSPDGRPLVAELPFQGAAVVPLMGAFGSVGDQRGGVRPQITDDGLRLEFTGSDQPVNMLSLLAKEPNRVGTMFGIPDARAGVAELCFEVRAEADAGADRPEVDFTTRGRGAVAVGLPLRVGPGWRRVVIPVQVTSGEQWANLLTVAVTGLAAEPTEGQPHRVTVTIRNAYIRLLHLQPQSADETSLL